MTDVHPKYWVCYETLLDLGALDGLFEEAFGDREGAVRGATCCGGAALYIARIVQAAVETGEGFERLPCHIWLTVHHYSQVQINMPVMQQMFKRMYNQRVGGVFNQKLAITKNPYISVKLLPTSDWADVIKSYIHKAMADVN